MRSRILRGATDTARIDDAVARLARSELLDVSTYAAAAGLGFATKADAARHYHLTGWRRGLNPSQQFDTAYYLRVNPDVQRENICPLDHYLRRGRREGRRPRVGDGPLSIRPKAPPAEVWRGLSRSRGADLPSGCAIDVVVPVYRGLDDTLACLHAVLTARSSTPFALIVVNDGSPDRELGAELRRLAAFDLFTLIEHETNRGFVASANVGLFLHPERDVVLLNADTIVYDGWLDRLVKHARRTGTGTVTPLSNNATICSYPRFVENNNCDLEVGHDAIDAIAAEVNAGASVEVPTGVGFCFYVRRALLSEIGGFDEATFGRGYGEENDFCRRAAAAGWRNVAALDVYVRHTGEVSFAAEAVEQRAGAAARLNALHPDYPDLVDRFIAADPMREARAAIDLRRATRSGPRSGVLFVDHAWIGGVLRHMHELVKRLDAQDSVVFRLSPIDDGARLALTTLSPIETPNLPTVAADDAAAITALLRRLHLRYVHVQSLVNHRIENFDALLDSLEALGLDYRLTVHDYAPICPRITMVDWGGSYCDSPSVDYCQTCVDKVGTDFGPVDVHRWLSAYRRVVEEAEVVLVPDEDVRERLERFGMARPMFVRPHQVWARSPDTAGARARRVGPRDALTVGIIGAIGPHKGSGVLLSMAGDITARRLPMRLLLYGYSDRQELERFDCVTVTGRYEEGEVERLVREAPCDLVFLPSVWPETYSYTLDVTLGLRLHPVCFDIGATAARLRSLQVGSLLPLGLIYDVAALNDTLLRIEPGAVDVRPLGPEAWWRSESAYYGRTDFADPIGGSSARARA